MKKMLLSGFVLTMSLCSYAQEKVKWGVQAGINLAKMNVSSSGVNVSFSSKTGLHAGISAEIGIDPNFAFQPELAYNSYGMKLDFSEMELEYPDMGDIELGETGKSNLNYLSLPLLFKYKVTNSGLGIYAGPQVGYLLSAKDVSGDFKEDTKEEYKSVDFLATFGAEYFLPQGIGLTARYQLGITNVAKNIGDDASIRNRAFTFGLGYRF